KSAGQGVEMDADFKLIPIGKSEILREGNDVALLALGTMVPIALKAADLLQQKGIEARVINSRFVKPLDRECLLALSHEKIPVVTLEEGSIMGGFGSAILEFYAEQNVYDMQVKVIGVPDYFVEHGTIEEQRREVGLTA